MYEFLVDRVEEPGISNTDLLSKFKQYPSDFNMNNMSPMQFASLAEKVSSDEATAIKYINGMCESASCYISSCNELCR